MMTNKVSSPDASNFVVEFGNNEAQIAQDIPPNKLNELLQSRQERYPVRWINIWKPNVEGGRQSLNYIGKHYGFSQRLVSLMTTSSKVFKDVAGYSCTKRRSSHIAATATEDLFNTNKSRRASAFPAMSRSAALDPRILLEYLKDTMNYTSTDHGDKFFCIGANWLHDSVNSRADIELTSGVPPKHWCWLIICDDNIPPHEEVARESCNPRSNFTVISIHEDPFSEDLPNVVPTDIKREFKAIELESMRRGTMMVLRQLSSVPGPDIDTHALNLKTIRKTNKFPMSDDITKHASTNTQMTSNSESEGLKLASNLFYYLFEDYLSAAPLLIESKEAIDELQAAVMENSRHNIKLRSPVRDVIPKLHRLGKDLRQVRHLFQSYRTIIERILDLPSYTESAQKGHSRVAAINPDPAIWFSQSAHRRFERLYYHIQLLVLNNIDEALEESKALTETYFNLMAQKDSEATARLTRSATLLAKLSVFFLPISFQTAFFSVEVDGFLDLYTGKHYWISFGIITSLSFLGLFFFSRILIVFNELFDNLSNKVIDAVYDQVKLRKDQVPSNSNGDGRNEP